MIFAPPVGQPFRVRHSVRREGPAAEWMAPSWKRGLDLEVGYWTDDGMGLTTPPPPSRDSFAALTIDVVARVVMEVRMREIFELNAEDADGSSVVSDEGRSWPVL